MVCRYCFNPSYQSKPDLKKYIYWSDDTLAFHLAIEGYQPTPLVSLPALADHLGVGAIWVKDESKRYGLNAFKGLGASYAIYRFIKKAWEDKYGGSFDVTDFFSTDIHQKLGTFTFCTATDGNHGRAVAWTARKLKQQAVIYVPENTVPARIEAIQSEGAQVVVVKGNYDQSVEQAAHDSQENGWQVISDTAYPGYLEIPGWIMTGYSTIFAELEQQLVQKPDFVFMQAGVGGLACAGTNYYVRKYLNNRPTLICVEPLDADCLLESIVQKRRSVSLGKQDSIMAGLNCGTPSMLAWPIIQEGMDFFMSIPDDYARDAMRQFYSPCLHDPKIVSGESGAAGLAGLLALCQAEELAEAKEKLSIGSQSTILLINTEGDTDPVNYCEITSF